MTNKLKNHVEQLIALFSYVNISEPVCYRIACDLIELDRLGINHCWKKTFMMFREQRVEQNFFITEHLKLREMIAITQPGLIAIISEYERLDSLVV